MNSSSSSNFGRPTRSNFLPRPLGGEGRGERVNHVRKGNLARISARALHSVLIAALVQALPANLRAEQPEQVATRLRQQALHDPTAMEIVTDLTTTIGPRLDGSEAEKRAATWAKNRFEQLGFDKVW